MLKTLTILALLLFPSQAIAEHLVSKEAHIDLHTDRVLRIDGPINQQSLFKFEKQYFDTLSSTGPRLVIINSGGGEVGAGLRMIELLEAEKAAGFKLICVVEDSAHSMAFNLLTHCDVRLAKRTSKMLVHKIAIAGVVNPFIRITAKTLREIAKALEQADEGFRQDNARAMHLTLGDYDLFANAERMWLSPKLLKLGYLQGYYYLEK
jgi:ATP-dependent protease ClpP protease subunit